MVASCKWQPCADLPASYQGADPRPLVVPSCVPSQSYLVTPVASLIASPQAASLVEFLLLQLHLKSEPSALD